MMDALAILKGARDLIAQPGKWTQGFYAKTSDSFFCSVDDENAVCWCSIGAIHKIGGNEPRSVREEAFRILRRAAPNAPNYENPIVIFNDDACTTQADVLALFDRAVELAEAA